MGPHRDAQRYAEISGRCLGGTVSVSGSIWGVVKTALLIIIYKCNNFPLKYYPHPQNLLDIDCTSLYNGSKRRYYAEDI